MLWIIFGEFKFGCLLHFVEAFDEEKVVYETIKMGELKDKWCVILCVYFYFIWFAHSCFNLVCRLVLILLEKTMLILELVCLMVWQEFLLILGFMILSLLVFLNVFLLTSLLGQPPLVVEFVLFLWIKKRHLVEFLVPVLVLWIEKIMWCRFQSVTMVDLDFDLWWILKVHFGVTSCPSWRIAWMQFFYVTLLKQSMITLLLGNV